MAYPPITTLPTPPSRQDPANFANDADAFLGALPTFQSQVNAAGTYIDGVGAAVDADATAAAGSAASAAASASAASQVASVWVSGGTYTIGNVRFSPITYSTYRAKTNHSGVTTDPSVDATNWVNISGFSALTDFGVTSSAAELNYNDITTLGTSEASKAVTADANGDVLLSQELTAISYNETYAAVTSTANAATINCEAGNSFSHTLTENTTFTFSNPPATGTSYGFTLKLVQDASASGFTVTWPTSVDYAGATAPTLTATASAVDVLVFYTHDGGTTWYGFVAGAAMA